MSLEIQDGKQEVHFPAKEDKFEFDSAVFGRLTVLEPAGKLYGSSTAYLCQCTCGNTTVVAGFSLRRGATKSCGCLQRESVTRRSTIHGLSKTPEYRSWASMHARCYNPESNRYHRYGARGVVVCERWHTFENFLKDMGNRPTGTTLDRKDNDGNYEKSNCRWSGRRTQARNTRTNVTFRYNDEMRTLAEIAELCFIPYKTLWARVHTMGWDLEYATSKPVR